LKINIKGKELTRICVSRLSIWLEGHSGDR